MASAAELKRLFNMQTELVAKMRNGPGILSADRAERKTKPYFQSKINAAEKMLSTFQNNHLNIVGDTTTEQRTALAYFTEQTDETMEALYIDYLNDLTAACSRLHPEIELINSTLNNGGNERTFGEAVHLPPKEPNLPTVDIPKFSGEFTEWRTFRDYFSSVIHENTRLSGSHKLHYLRSVVTGEAFDIIAEFQLTDEDYELAWDALKEKYTDSSQMFMHIMDKFSAQPKIAAESPEQLKAMVKTTKVCVKALEDMKFEKRHFESIIAYFILQKLPPETVAYWESTRDKKKLPMLDTISACIDVRVRMSAAINKHQSSLASAEIKPKHPQRENFVKKKGNVKTYHVSSTSSTNDGQTGKYKCHCCGGEGHALRKCQKFISSSCSERKTLVDKINYCSNCLSYDHQLPKCKSPRNCSICGERHNTLLHTSVLESNAVARI